MDGLQSSYAAPASPATKPPVTIIVRHPRERPAKCSVYPLRDRTDLLFINYPPTELPDLTNYVRLAPDGPALSLADAERGLLVLDGSWRWAEKMTKRFESVPPRSLTGFRTAYPRVSKMFQDPPGGLATVEALFLALHILGRPTEGLLEHYRWREEFLEANSIMPSPVFIGAKRAALEGGADPTVSPACEPRSH